MTQAVQAAIEGLGPASDTNNDADTPNEEQESDDPPQEEAATTEERRQYHLSATRDGDPTASRVILTADAYAALRDNPHYRSNPVYRESESPGAVICNHLSTSRGFAPPRHDPDGASTPPLEGYTRGISMAHLQYCIRNYAVSQMVLTHAFDSLAVIRNLIDRGANAG